MHSWLRLTSHDLLANPTMSQLAWELVVDRCGELEGTVAAHGSLLAELSELRFEREQIKQLKATVEL